MWLQAVGYLCVYTLVGDSISTLFIIELDALGDELDMIGEDEEPSYLSAGMELIQHLPFVKICISSGTNDRTW